jgi:hypothetical protein
MGTSTRMIELQYGTLIWAYDYGARSKRRWPAKHDTILVYVKDPERYYFDSEAVDREPYMAPALSRPKRPRAASSRPTSGGTPSSPSRSSRSGTPVLRLARCLERHAEGSIHACHGAASISSWIVCWRPTASERAFAILEAQPRP